ncbi:Hsp70 family protein [bacterium]|nr:Hsp70 family protein [bacterium]
MNCQNPDCFGLDLKNNELFCPWCGQRCDVRLRAEENIGDTSEVWVPIQRFFWEERPALRLVLAADEGAKLPPSLPAVRCQSKWLAVGEWKACGETFCAALRYLPEALPAGIEKRSFSAELELPLPELGTVRTHLDVYPRPSYGLEASADSSGTVTLLKDDQGMAHLSFELVSFGPTSDMRLQAHVPRAFLAEDSAAPGGSPAGLSRSAVTLSKQRGQAGDDLPNFWGTAVPPVAKSESARAEDSLWNRQSIEVQWLDGENSPRRRGRIDYKVRGGDSAPYNISFSVRYRGRIGRDGWRRQRFTQEFSLPVRVIGRPVLKFLGSVGRTSWSVLTNRREDFSLPVEVTNGGRDSTLEITGVQLREVPPELQVTLSGALVDGGVIVNREGQAKPLQVRLHLQETPPVGNYTFYLVISYTDPGAPQGQERAEFARLIGMRVGQPLTLPGSVLAVDFGTSSSCAAVMGLGEAQEMIAVDDAGSDRCSLASLALYAKDKTTLGEAARLLSYRYPLALLEAPKREIGKREYFEVLPAEQSWTKISTAEVVREFYRCLIRRAQDSAVAVMRASKNDWNRCNFENLAISHPSRFNYAQKQMMAQAARAAFAEVFGRTEVRQELVQEPLAAALAYVSDSEVQTAWHSRRGSDDIAYSLLVYDCGGGTTDLCCLEVHSRRASSLGDSCTDFAQLSQAQRQRLLPLALRRLLPQAAEAELASWQKAISDCPDWIWAWSEHPELMKLGFDAETLAAAIAGCANELQERDSFTVDVRIKGASGDPTFGGSNVTEEIASLVRSCFSDLIADDSSDNDKKVKARRNTILLSGFAEQLKCHVSASDTSFIDAMVDGELSGTLVTMNGPVPSAELKKQLSSVNRGLYKRLRYAVGGSQTRIANLADECMILSKRCFGTKSPDIILLTGRGSQWPGIRESLEFKFKGVPVVLWGDSNAVKHCVAKGAGVLALVKSGAKLAGGPGVHITNIYEDVYTTSSLCLQSGPEMTEIIGAGCSFGADAIIRGNYAWQLSPGETKIEVTVYQSDVPGACHVSSNSAHSSGVSKLHTFTIALAEAVSAGETGQICLELSPGKQPGYADLRAALEWSKGKTYGALANGSDRLAVMIMNK